MVRPRTLVRYTLHAQEGVFLEDDKNPCFHDKFPSASRNVGMAEQEPTAAVEAEVAEGQAAG